MASSYTWKFRDGTVRLDTMLWIAQSIVAFVYSWVGALRALVPIHSLEREAGWLDSVAAQVPIRTVGAVELVLALLVIVPSMQRFLPRLAAWAAAGLAVFSACGLVEHVMHGEWLRAVGALILVALSVFVAWGRAFAVPIPVESFVEELEEDQAAFPAGAHRPINMV